MRSHCADQDRYAKFAIAGFALPALPLLALAILTFSASSALAQQADDSGLTARVEQLEQQLVEMQVAVGTLESLAKGRPAGGGSYQAPARNTGGAGSAQMEIQIRALSGQVAALSRQVRALQNGRVANTGGLTNNSYAQPTGSSSLQNNDTSGGGFGTVTVTNEAQGGQAGSSDPIGSILSDGSGNSDTLGWQDGSSNQVASVDSVPPRQAYDTAYGYLLQQDYGAAETAFGEFVQRYPQDKLAGNAQYWLGESHYVRGNYRTAAQAFLKGYKTYGKSNKAPDTLLKLAMSLSRLGQKPSACATFQKLTSAYPNAPNNILRRSQAERQRAGC